MQDRTESLFPNGRFRSNTDIAGMGRKRALAFFVNKPAFGLYGPACRGVIQVGRSIGRSLLNLARFVVGGRIDDVNLHWFFADVGDVVPRPGRNQNAPTVGNLLVKRELILRSANLDAASTGIQAKKLVGFRMHLQSNVTAHWNRHEGQLQIATAPRHAAIFRVLAAGFLKIKRFGARADVLDFHDPLPFCKEHSAIMGSAFQPH